MDEEKDCSETYMPIWKRQIIIAVVVLVSAIGGIIAAAMKNLKLFYFLFGAAIVINVVSSFMLKCPGCGCNVCWKTKSRGYATRAFALLPFDKKCPQCGAVLRK